MNTAPPTAAAARPMTTPPAAMPAPRNATAANPVVPQPRTTAAHPVVPQPRTTAAHPVVPQPPRAAGSSNRGLQVDLDEETDDEDGDHTTVSIERNPFHRPQR